MSIYCILLKSMTNKEQVFNISTVEDLETVVLKFLPSLNSKEVIWLAGPLGAGKSEWVRRSIKHLGYLQEIPSPSFTIHNSYPIGKHWVHHIDLYRIQNEQELESIDFYDLFLEKTGCVFVEWADRVSIDKKFLNWNQLFLNFKWRNQERYVHIRKSL